MRRFLILGLVALVATGAILTACGGDDKKTFDLGDGNEVSVGGGIPDDFPDDFPIYPGADVQGSYTGEQDGVSGSVVIWETGDSVDDVKAFYEAEFDGSPWAAEGSFNSAGSTLIGFTNSDSNKTGAVTLGESDGKTTISVIIGDDTSGGGSSDGDDSSSDGDDSPSDGDSSSDGDDSSSDGDGSSGSADLPEEIDIEDDYPADDIPLPDGARVTQSSSISAGGSNTIFVTMYVDQSVDDLEQYYKDTLADAGYTESFSTSSGGEVFLTFTKGDTTTSPESATVTLTESDVEGYTLVNISLSIVGS